MRSVHADPRFQYPMPACTSPRGFKVRGRVRVEHNPKKHMLSAQWTPGSKGAHLLLDDFVLRRLAAFDADRAKTDRASTSRLSPHVHFGEISVRFMFHVARPSSTSRLTPSTLALALTRAPGGLSLRLLFHACKKRLDILLPGRQQGLQFSVRVCFRRGRKERLRAVRR